MCPGCDSAMQAFFAAGVDGLEVDRCHFCGGFWLDGGELEGVLGHAVEFEDTGSDSRRRCVGCAVTLRCVHVQDVAAERCSLCGGVYLDDGELETLAREGVRLAPTTSARAAAGASARERITFRCAGCGSERELDEGLATGRGLACSLCVGSLNDVPMVNVPGVRWGVRQRYGYTDVVAHGAFTGLDDLVSFVARLFR